MRIPEMDVTAVTLAERPDGKIECVMQGYLTPEERQQLRDVAPYLEITLTEI